MMHIQNTPYENTGVYLKYIGMPIYGDWHILISTFAGRSQRRCCHAVTNQCVLTTFQREQLYGLSHDRDMSFEAILLFNVGYYCSLCRQNL